MAFKKTGFVIPEESITNKIYFLRGQKVMLDKDLAVLYGVKSIRLREQVKGNAERFPDKFMFQLTEREVNTQRYFTKTGAVGETGCSEQ